MPQLADGAAHEPAAGNPYDGEPAPSAGPGGDEPRVVRVGGQSVRVQVRGDGPPVLLLNGLGAPLELWQPLVDELGGHTTVALDAPGSGDSPAPAVPLTVAGHARLALRVLERLRRDGALGGPASVLGFSFGGLVAQEVARQAGPAVRRLVLASTSCGVGSVPGAPSALLAVSTPDRYYSRSLFQAVAPAYVGGRESADERFLQEQAAVRAAHPPDPRGYLGQLWAAATWSSLPWLCTLRTRTLVLSGDRDPLVPYVNSQVLAAVLPDARLHVVAGGGHLSLLERAAELGPVLRDFLA